ncbi:MAG: hypothetical protein KatS3mg077_0383 [Candidatus Binatia bacterium]|nr:MAG: hypothetical protein KatS3mg077_0383 [Candidatus Binatia bacterium]
MGQCQVSLARPASTLALAVALFCLVSTASAAGPRVKFVNPTSKVLRDWPIAVSVPLAPGSARDVGALRLRSLSGDAVPSRGEILARWEDGSARWVRLNGTVELGPRQAGEFVVDAGAEAEVGKKGSGARVVVQQSDNKVEVDTGAMRLVVRQGSPRWLDLVSLEGKPITGVHLTGEARVNGHDCPLGPIQSLVVLATGPVRALVELRGRYEHCPLQYRVRLESFAGKPVVRAWHTFEVHAQEPTAHLERLSAALALPQLHRPQAAFLRGDHASPVQVHPPRTIRQADNTAYVIGADRQSGTLLGWFDLHDARMGVTLWARWFWQQYPQAVQFRENQLRYDLYDGSLGSALAGTGAAKTHEFVLAFRRSGKAWEIDELRNFPIEGTVEATGLATNYGLAGAAIGRTAEATQFVRRLIEAWGRVERSYDREEWDDRQKVECPRTEGPDPHERRRRGFYGMWNWGDWNYPGYHDTTKGCDAWGNLEYDLTQVLALSYAATGEGRLREAMEAAGRHFMDVDIIHFQPRYPQWVGMNHPKNPLHWSFELGGVDLGHTWTEGLLSLYLLTGDDRGLAAARGIGEFLLRRLKAPLKGNPRQFGWPQIALIALYEVTREPRYLEGAQQYARLGMERHRPDSIGDWKLGILAEGLAYTHRHSRSPEIRRWLSDYTRAVLAATEKTDIRLWPAVAYVAALDGNQAATRAAKAVVDRLDFGNWAKPFTIAGRVGFAILSNLGSADEKAGDFRNDGRNSHPRAETPEKAASPQ